MSEQEPWERVTVRLPESMLEDLEAAVEDGGAPNRSAAIRECIERTDLGAIYR